MPAISYSHTLGVKAVWGSGWSGAPCSFKSSAAARGRHWQVHHGKLMDRLLGGRDVVVKFPVQADPEAGDPVALEVANLDLARRALEASPDLARVVRLAETFTSRVDKVGRLARAKACTPLRSEVKVLVQERLAGRITCLLPLGSGEEEEEGEGREEGVVDMDKESMAAVLALEALARSSYVVSGGSCVIAGAKGAVERDVSSGAAVCVVTSLTVHSHAGSRSRPSAPPPEDQQPTVLHPQDPLTPDPRGDDVAGLLAVVAARVARDPELRGLLTETQLQLLWGRPPPYR